MTPLQTAPHAVMLRVMLPLAQATQPMLAGERVATLAVRDLLWNIEWRADFSSRSAFTIDGDHLW